MRVHRCLFLRAQSLQRQKLFSIYKLVVACWQYDFAQIFSNRGIGRNQTTQFHQQTFHSHSVRDGRTAFQIAVGRH